MDAAAIISLGKLVLFKLTWDELRFRATTKNPSERDLVSFRTAIMQAVNQLSDETFFMPPKMITSVEKLEEYYKAKFRKEKLMDKILAEERLLTKRSSTLIDYEG